MSELNKSCCLLCKAKSRPKQRIAKRSIFSFGRCCRRRRRRLGYANGFTFTAAAAAEPTPGKLWAVAQRLGRPRRASRKTVPASEQRLVMVGSRAKCMAAPSWPGNELFMQQLLSSKSRRSWPSAGQEELGAAWLIIDAAIYFYYQNPSPHLNKTSATAAFCSTKIERLWSFFWRLLRIHDMPFSIFIK